MGGEYSSQSSPRPLLSKDIAVSNRTDPIRKRSSNFRQNRAAVSNVAGPVKLPEAGPHFFPMELLRVDRAVVTAALDGGILEEFWS